MPSETIDIASYLEQYKEGCVHYIPNPGNAGDAIIASATYQLMDSLGLKYKTVNRSRFLHRGEVVFYGGGGNFGLMRNFSTKFIQRIHRNVKKLVILPHTIKDVSPVLKELGGNVDIICREQVSYDYVKSTAINANVYLCDDMAFGLDTNKLLQLKPTLMMKLAQVFLYGVAKLRLSSGQPTLLGNVFKLMQIERQMKSFYKIQPSLALNAFRLDGEKTSIAIPSDNIDISEAFSLGVENKALTFITASLFLNYINRFDEVNTNRLHVCISAALLGKKVNFYGNNYYKCKAIYEQSLTEFANVNWINPE